MPVPTVRLALVATALAVVVLAMPLAMPWALVTVNAVLAVVAGLDWALAPAPKRLGVTRTVPAVRELDSSGEITWRVQNPTDRRLRVGLADDLAPSLRAGTRRAHLTVPAGATVRAGTTFRPSRRGRFEIRTLTLRIEGPLGLVARQGDIDRPAVLRVHPRYRSRLEAEQRINRSRLETGLRSSVGRGGGTEFDALREYSVDDEIRRVDWAATARANRAIVRTYRAEQNQTVLCLVDSGRTMAAKVADVPRLEHAMDAAMMLTHVASRLGDRAGMLAFDSDVRAVVPPRPGRGQLTRVTEALYDLEPRLVESDYRAAFAAALARFPKRAMLVVLTELAEQAVTETLLPALPLIARSHLVVVAGVTDPAVERWATAVPAEAGTAYRKAAAVAALEERRRVVARLRSLGATVVDEPPGDLAPALADAYLRVKHTGRL
jgi:uncharacterized protein (DUF58 family)